MDYVVCAGSIFDNTAVLSQQQLCIL